MIILEDFEGRWKSLGDSNNSGDPKKDDYYPSDNIIFRVRVEDNFILFESEEPLFGEWLKEEPFYLKHEALISPIMNARGTNLQEVVHLAHGRKDLMIHNLVWIEDISTKESTNGSWRCRRI
ncbi:hypothetical protein [Pleionea sp. CnH1-48]|uniref:hypothetical protein n=1 Tax=Pleionea sp. CnH1-48 TaxID=2954494 RepID=UPI002097E533|nr:hypothetical protein [Pleionea sp. CnH1-48]MCO7224951.1 hypothetical protein [Pleionea sp. CnH1-48]